MKSLTEAAESTVGGETVPTVCPHCIRPEDVVSNPPKWSGLAYLQLCAEAADEALAIQRGR